MQNPLIVSLHYNEPDSVNAGVAGYDQISIKINRFQDRVTHQSRFQIIQFNLAGWRPYEIGILFQQPAHIIGMLRVIWHMFLEIVKHAQ